MTGAKAAARDEDGARDDRAAPIRLCAVSRAHHPVENLIRFVPAPDGTMVPGGYALQTVSSGYYQAVWISGN